MWKKKIFSVQSAVILLFLALPFQQVKAEDEIYTTFFSNAAAGGYDVVAYFTEQKPVKGKDDFKMEFKGADWYFSNVINLEKFRLNPEAYRPQYGGYCAWAVTIGTTAKGDPNKWTVHKGKLYLNYDDEIQQNWLLNIDKNISLAEKNWPKVIQ